ncbi:DNA-binding transcriptional LysR family regulator [Inquilinus ginsengisoli]|uniref:DNA-binding transcriptional LysR family regulator n=1 Tax=Inquilinus ginsengisoli TaxID=363840 RepID=A0ABU1JXU4_9PROT|nr:LysR family transcriptional regulator [Inquilinus ginsengisoli]MDR6293452.1 DNA-binding transcriptional LysR family regulator [Inquilinus ginsengisoli]
MNRLAAMEAFIRVVDAGSFSGAARQLCVGQPAVSKTIAQLEDRLGVRLLLRSTHRLTPTDAGRTFYQRAKRAIEEADEAEHAARGAAATLSGRLRVCGAVTFARLHVIPRLSLFLAEHPALDVDVVLDDRQIDMIEAGVDLALRMGRLDDSTLTARRIGQCRRCVIGTPAYFKAAGVPQAPVDLAAHQAVIHDQPGAGAAWTFRRGSVERSVTLRGRLRANAAEGVREGVLGGLGLAIASEWMFAPELASGAVVPVMQDWSLPPLDLWAVFPSGRQASAKARAFADFVEAQLSGGATR